MKRLFSILLVVCLIASVCCVPASAASTFDDIKGTEWYAPAVSYCSSNGYMSGTGNNKFDPNGRVSRAQMAQILYNFAGRPDMTNAENPFTDVKRDAWYGSAVLFAKTTGIVNGTSSTTYSPNNYITREQVAVMLMGYYKASTGNTQSVNNSVLNSYTDKNMISSWAQGAVAWAVEHKIMSGVGNNKIDPKGTCTRAQLAQFIMNYCENIGTPAPIEPDIPVDDIVKELIGNTKPLPEDWLPKGGYIQGGRKYNMYGIDITDVDGIPDREEARLINMINDYREENSLPRLQWNQHAQIMSEVRAREAMWIYANNLNSADKYGTPHVRPDGTTADYCDYENNENGNQCLTTKNSLMIEELNVTESMIDCNMTNTGKTINMDKLNNRPFLYENLGRRATTDETKVPEQSLTGWQNSSGHNAALLYDFAANNFGNYGYIACAFALDIKNQLYVSQYNAYALDWIGPAEPTPPPVLDPDDSEEWYPGKGIHYDHLGFTLDDIPTEYPDWILRDPDMDLESYGPTDHDINSLNAWLTDNGVAENSDVWYQVKAHYFSTLSMDDYLKFMFSNTDVFHYTQLMEDGLFPIDTLEDYEIEFIKETLVSAVADKLAYQHLEEIGSTLNKCEVCGKNHSEKRDLAAAEQVVNQFFQDTYGFDISAY